MPSQAIADKPGQRHRGGHVALGPPQHELVAGRNGHVLDLGARRAPGASLACRHDLGLVSLVGGIYLPLAVLVGVADDRAAAVDDGHLRADDHRQPPGEPIDVAPASGDPLGGPERLLNQMENQPEDRHELYLQIREKLCPDPLLGLDQDTKDCRVAACAERLLKVGHAHPLRLTVGIAQARVTQHGRHDLDIAALGVGNVGASFAYALLLSGLASEIVLIDADNKYTLSTVPKISQFNHVIVYLPEFDLYVDAINEAVKELPAGVVVGVHMCRGNYKGMYLSEGGYDSVAEKLFGRAQVNHFLLEFDTPRAGGFAPLRHVPKDKGVVLGLVSSKTPVLEKMDALKKKADEAAQFIDPARLAISPQCGFASTMGGNPVTEADERAKLRLCVDAAENIWG